MILCVVGSFRASRRSNALGRTFWQLATFSFALIVVPQTLQTLHDVVPLTPFLQWLSNTLFVFWYGAMSMALFLDSDFEPKRFDRLHVFDFIQAFVFWVAVFLYFSPSPLHSLTPQGLARTLWQRSLIYDGVLSCAFVLRSTKSFHDPTRNVPSALSGQRGRLPLAFGYGARHLSARGALTLQNNALLRTQFRFADATGIVAGWLASKCCAG
jgi:hypothetical protein